LLSLFDGAVFPWDPTSKVCAPELTHPPRTTVIAAHTNLFGLFLNSDKARSLLL
jgi:hypothetical protein